jgi:hypothetical protein
MSPRTYNYNLRINISFPEAEILLISFQESINLSILLYFAEAKKD